MDYFELFSDEADEDQWWLGTPRVATTGAEVDVWAFTMCKRFEGQGNLVVPVLEPGLKRDVVFGELDIPYVSPRAASVFEAIAGEDIQCVPARTEDGSPVAIVNLLCSVDCLDEERSNLTYDREGKPNMVLELRVDPVRVGSHHAFRISTWNGPFVVSARILAELKAVGASGFVATRVS